MDDKETQAGSEMNSESRKKPSNTNNFIIIALAVLLIGGGTFYAVRKMNKPQTPVQPQVEGAQTQKPKGPPSIKGQNFADTPLFSQAVQIYPGVVSESAKAVMSGWILKTKVLPYGTTQADLIPVGSEEAEGDTAHTFILKTGDKLYFADLNPNDDGSTEDQNTHDDMGIVVDASGIVQ